MRTFALVVTLFVVACQRQPPPAPPAAPAAPAVDPALARLPLVARLEREAHARPTGTPRTEDVLAAFARGGLKVEPPQQVLASVIGAAYCTSAATDKGAVVAVCEYPAEDAARRGLEYSRQTFDRLVPGRRLYVNRKKIGRAHV